MSPRAPRSDTYFFTVSRTASSAPPTMFCTSLQFSPRPLRLGSWRRRDPADSLLDGALYLTSGARDAIFVHGILWVCATTNSGRGRRFIRPQITTTQVGARLPLRRRD